MREEWRYATFSERWGADFIDSLIMTAVGIPAFFLIDVPLSREDAVGATEIAWLCWFLWNWTYLVGTTGQSWGRRIAGLQVIMRDGEPIGVWRALGRNLFAMFISAPLLYLGFLWAIWDEDKQAWHDKVFGTFVMRKVFL